MKETKQKGAALIIFAVIFALAATTFLISQLDASGVKIERDKKTSLALAEAKSALIGDAISQPLTSEGLLRLPDIGFSTSPSGPSEGSSIANFIDNNKNYSVIGKLPWKTLGMAPLKDGYGECLWYVVSGRFKKNPITDILNWDTQGQIDVIDPNGNLIATNLAALIVAPRFTLENQSRSLEHAAYSQCGGNYDARNYLDAYNAANALAGELNYFSSSLNNRVALNANNKTFVLAKNDFYNDQFAFVTVDEIFNPIIRRKDFSSQVAALLEDDEFKIHLQAITVVGSKGTGNINCGSIATSTYNKEFCDNWKEMLLLTQLPPTSSIVINGVNTPCNRLLIFGGKKTIIQARITAANKSDPANYLEGDNLNAFNTSTADFDGVSEFSVNSPGADVLRCL